MSGIKVLEIGGGSLPKAHIVPGWEEAEVVTLDADEKHNPDILCDARNIPTEHWGQFDGILASHVLEHFGYWETESVLLHWRSLLKDKGELHIVVPSLEWVARAVMSEELPVQVFPHMFGGHDSEWNGHKAMFTMRLLRMYLENTGYMVRKARTGLYNIRVLDGHGKEHILPAQEHYVMGVKGDIMESNLQPEPEEAGKEVA